MTARTLIKAFTAKQTEFNQRLKTLEKDSEQIAALAAAQDEARSEITDWQRYIAHAESQMEALKQDHQEASFDQDQDKLKAVQDSRKKLLNDIEDAELKIEEQQRVIKANTIDSVFAAQVKAELDITSTPDFVTFVTELKKLLILEKDGIADRIKKARNSVRGYSQEDYDNARKAIDRYYHSHADVEASAKRRQLAVEDERRQFEARKPVMIKDGEIVRDVEDGTLYQKV